MLDRIEELAREAEAWSETIGEDNWYDEQELITLGTIDGIETIDGFDAAFIAACDPATILRLVRVARAAKEASEYHEHMAGILRCGLSPQDAALRAAVQELDKP